MNKLRKIQLSIIAVVVVGLIVAAGTYMVVPTFAQETDKTTKETPINKFLSKVASILGIEEEILTSAMEQAKQEIDDETKEELKAKLQAAVDSGEITQEQADEKLEGFDNQPKEWGKGNKKQKGFGKHEKGDDIRSQIRDKKPNWPAKPAFDIEKIQEEYKKLVADGEITQEQADERLKELKSGKPGFPGLRGGPTTKDLDAIKARIEKAIADGEITQEQVDERLKGLKNLGQRNGEMKPPSQADIKARIQAAVDSGQITQEQAEERYKVWAEGLQTRGVK